MTHTILVTGGAGYIGSHMVLLLLDLGYKVVVIDDLSTGNRQHVPETVRFYEGKVNDRDLLRKIFATHRVVAVMHFAGAVVVEESVKNPDKYWDINCEQPKVLLDECLMAGVQSFVFSSTAAVYGDADINPVDESAPTKPISPYGESKLAFENHLRSVLRGRDMQFAVLRYFNVGGADLRGRIGQINDQASHLIKIACEVACGIRDHMRVFGTDYDTVDGTGVRDYIHVDDLVQIHAKVLVRLLLDGESIRALNCGYGHGVSVQEMIKAVQTVSGVNFRVENAPRRAGDPAALYANTSFLHDLDCAPEPMSKEARLMQIAQSAYAWEKSQHEK